MQVYCLTRSFPVAHGSLCTHGFNHRLKNSGEVGEAGDCLEFPWKCLHITASLNLDEQALLIIVMLFSSNFF